MKTLVAYYSRTGNTEKVAQEISKGLKSEVETIIDTKNRSGPIGWLSAGLDTSRKTLAEIKEVKKDPSKYDLVIIGTPVWGGNIAAPIRTYITKKKEDFKKVAFFLTQGGEESNAFKEMKAIIGKKPIATLRVGSADVKQGKHVKQAARFVEEILERQ